MGQWQSKYQSQQDEEQVGDTDSSFPWAFSSFLGYGTFGKVYRVVSNYDGHEYALKETYYPPKQRDFERCLNEIKTLSKLDSPFVIRYFTELTGVYNEKVMIQMELCGKDLKSCLENEIVATDLVRPQSVKIFHQLLCGLDYIHSQNLIHRALKPSNIFVDMNGFEINVKIGDFGYASYVDDPLASYVGRPLYQAPEQLTLWDTYDNKVDMYALGIVIFEVRKKKFDVNEDAWIMCLKNLCKRTMHTLKEFEPYEPPVWEQIFAALLASEPCHRPNAKDVLHEFIPVLGEIKSQQIEAPVSSLMENAALHESGGMLFQILAPLKEIKRKPYCRVFFCKIKKYPREALLVS